MHKQVNADHLVELVYTQPADSFENTEEYCTENDAPSDNHDAAEALCLDHRKAACVYKAEVVVKYTNSKAAPHATKAEYLEASDRIINLVAIKELASRHGG